MSLINKLTCLNRLTRTLGLSPLLSIQTTPLHNAVFTTLQFIYITVLATPSIYQLYLLCSQTLIVSKLELTRLISLLELLFLNTTVIITLLFSLVFHNNYISITTKFYKIQNLITSLQVDVLQDQDNKIRYLQVFLITLAIGFNVLEYFENGYINWSYIIILPIALLSLYQFLYLIMCINYCYQCVNNYLRNYAKKNVNTPLDYKGDWVFDDNLKYFGLYSTWQQSNCSYLRNNQIKTNDWIRVKNIEITREIHRLLYDLCKRINDYFSVHIILWLATKITTITIVLYYLLSATKMEELWLGQSDYWTPRFNKAILAITYFLQLTAVVFVCVAASEEASSTGILVHGLLNSSTHNGLTQDLMLFSRQILHQKISFTAAGLFSLDFTLINGVIGAVTTYLVVLIQFQLST